MHLKFMVIPCTLDVEEMTDPVTQNRSSSADGDAFCTIFGITHLHVKVVWLCVSRTQTY